MTQQNIPRLQQAQGRRDAKSRPFNPATQANSQTQGLPQQPNAEAWAGIANRYMEELAKAYSAAIGGDVAKVHVSNPEKFGAVVNAVDMLKGEKIGQGLDPIEAGTAAFQDVFLQMGIEQTKGGIAPGLSMMLADKQKEELRNAPEPSQFQNIKTGFTNPEGNLTPMSVVRGISGTLGGGDIGINRGPLAPSYDEGVEARAALGNPFTPMIPKSFVDDTGGFNRVARETIRDFSSPGALSISAAAAGGTVMGAAALRAASVKAAASSPAKAKALTIAANLIDDGTYATALRMEAQGELGAGLLINALEDQGVELNLAQQIGAGLLGGVGAIAVPSLAKKGITSGAGQINRRLDPGSSIDLGVDDLEVRRQQLDFVANADRKTADRQQVEMLLNAEGRGSTLEPGDALEADDPALRRGVKGVELNQETGQYEEVPLPTAKTPGEAVERAMRPPDNTYSLLGDSRRPFGNSRGLTSGLPGLPGSDAPWAPNSAVVRDFDDLRRGTRASYPNMSEEMIDASVEFFRRRAELVAPKRGITPEQWLRTKIAGFNLDGIIYMDGQSVSSTREFGLGGVTTGMPTVDPLMSGKASMFIRSVVQSNQGRAGGLGGGGRGITTEELTSEAETLWHEFGHVIRKDLWDMDEDALSVLEAWAGIPTGSTQSATSRWGPDAEERFARGFVQWLSEGIEPEGWSAELKQVFLNIAHWLKVVPEATGAGTAGRQSLEDPEVRKAFDQILSDKKLLGVVETESYLDDIGARSIDFDDDPNAGRFGNPELEVGKKSLKRQLDDLDQDIDDLERIGKEAYGDNYDNVLNDLLSEREGIQDQLDLELFGPLLIDDTSAPLFSENPERGFADQGAGTTPEGDDALGRARERRANRGQSLDDQLEADVAAKRDEELVDAPDFAGKTKANDDTILEDPWARYNEDIKVPEDRAAQALQEARVRQSERLGLEPGDPVSVEAEKSALAGTAIPFETSDRLVREHITPRMVDIIKRAGRQTDADIEARAATARQAAAASANIYRTSDLTGEALGKQATGPLKAVDEKPLSAYERAPLRGEGADPANALSSADIHLIFESVNRNPRMKPYTKLNTFKAIYKLIDGEHVTKFDIQRLRAVFGKEVTAGMFDTRGLKRKIFDEIMDILGIPRLLLATMDFSAPLRQALLPLGGHPIRWAKTWGPAWKGAISGKYYDQQRAARQAKANHRIFTEPSSPNLPENQRGLGLFETDPEAGLAQSEEAFLSEFLKKLPDRAGNLAAWATKTPGAKKPVKSILSGVGTVAGYPIRFSERGWSGFLDELRYGLMDDAWESWKRPGSLDSKGKASFNLDRATGDLVPTGQTLKDGRDLARYINISTGRGDLGMLEGAAAPLANIFFSPRLMAARFEAPYELLRYDRSKRVKNHIYRDMAGLIGGGSTVLGLAAIAGASVEINPTSSDGGRIQVGNTRVDIWGGFQPLVRTIARVAMRERKSTGTGRVTDLDKDGIGLVAQEIINFFRAKLAPVVGFGVDIGAKGDFTGDEIDFGPGNRMDLVIARFAPLLAQDLIESYRTDGLTGAALAAPSFFGTSVISYQGVEEVSRRDYKYPEGHPNEDRPGRKGLANLTDSDHSVFQDLPPFLQDNAIAMNKFEGSQQDSEFSAQIAQIDEDYFTTLTGIVDDMDKTDSEKVSAFFAAGNTRADRRSEAFKTQYGDFERPDGEPKDDNARAMRSYYDLVNLSINADKSFNRERFNNGYAEYEGIWSEEQIQWVRSNTNSKIIPDKMFDILPDKQKINFMLSNNARDELTEIWAKDEAEVNAQIESRRPDIEEVRTGIKEGQVVIDSDYNDARIRDGLPPLAGAAEAADTTFMTGNEVRAQNAKKKKLLPPLAVPTRVPDDIFMTGDEVRATAAAGR